MHNVQAEYIGRHRDDGQHDDCAARASAHRQLQGAMRGVPNESPRHADRTHRFDPQLSLRYETCVINSQGRCVRWAHDHRDESC